MFMFYLTTLTSNLNAMKKQYPYPLLVATFIQPKPSIHEHQPPVAQHCFCHQGHQHLRVDPSERRDAPLSVKDGARQSGEHARHVSGVNVNYGIVGEAASQLVDCTYNRITVVDLFWSH